MKRLVWPIMIACLCGPVVPALGQVPAEAVAVEPAELDRRDDLVGRQVVVDDHVRYYVPPHRDGTGRTSVEANADYLRGPAVASVRRHRPGPSPRSFGACSAREAAWSVTSPRYSRLAAISIGSRTGSKASPPGISRDAKPGGSWAERRSKDFKDNALGDRACALEGECFASNQR